MYLPAKNATWSQWRIQGGGQEAMASPFGIRHASGPFGSLECSDVPKGATGAPEVQG